MNEKLISLTPVHVDIAAEFPVRNFFLLQQLLRCSYFLFLSLLFAFWMAKILCHKYISHHQRNGYTASKTYFCGEKGISHYFKVGLYYLTPLIKTSSPISLLECLKLLVFCPLHWKYNKPLLRTLIITFKNHQKLPRNNKASDSLFSNISLNLFSALSCTKAFCMKSCVGILLLTLSSRHSFKRD